MILNVSISFLEAMGNKSHKDIAEIEFLSNNSCFIANCAEYRCQSDNCCECMRCVAGGVSCNECPDDWTWNHTTNHCEKKMCYVKRGNGTDNEYCFGSSTYCQKSGYTELDRNKDSYNCGEQSACYKSIADNKYVAGRYSNQSGYEYVGSSCPSPACYKNINDVYRWTDMPNNDEEKVIGIESEADCKYNKNDIGKTSDTKKEDTTANGGSGLVLFIIFGVIASISIVSIILVIKNDKKNSQNIGNF